MRSYHRDCYSVHGRFLQQVVSEFVLKGKQEKYQKVIEGTFRRIRRRYKGFRYVIQSETYEKNGQVYVKFLFTDEHSEEGLSRWREIWHRLLILGQEH